MRGKIPGETAEECAKRLRRDYDSHIEMLWDDYVGHLSGVFGLTNEEATKLLEDAD